MKTYDQKVRKKGSTIRAKTKVQQSIKARTEVGGKSLHFFEICRKHNCSDMCIVITENTLESLW